MRSALAAYRGTVNPLWYLDRLAVVGSPRCPPRLALSAPAPTCARHARAGRGARPSGGELHYFGSRRGIRATRAPSGLGTKACWRLFAGAAPVYSDRERVRIKLILRGKRLGLALSEIRELLDLYATTRNERPQLEKFLVMLSDRRARLLQQREDIDAVLAEIVVLERDCRRRLKANGPPASAAGKAAARAG